MAQDLWVEHFLDELASQYFVRVPATFIGEFLEKTDLSARFSLLDAAKSVLLENKEPSEEVEKQVRMIYMLAHADYLETEQGMELMYQKKGSVMQCPRVFCKDTPCWPCRASSNIGESTIKMYCPTCKQIYNPENKIFDAVDGVGFPKRYIENMVEKHPDLVLQEEQVEYVPRIYGFRVFNGAEEPAPTEGDPE